MFRTPEEKVRLIPLARAGIVDKKVKKSENGVFCLRCLQEVYDEGWSVMDNGTWYCPEHIEKLRKLFGEINERVGKKV